MRHLQLRADVLTDVHVGDVDRNDFERGARIQTFCEHGFTDAIRIFQHLFMIERRADRGNNAFTDARHDSRFARAADVTVEIASHGNPGFDVELNAVLRNALEDRRFDDFGVHRRLQRLKHVAAGQVDCGRALPFQRNLRALRRDHREHAVFDVAARQVMRLQLIHV